jgi:hypothetical protein
MHEGTEQRLRILVIPVLRHMKRRLDRAYEVVLLAKLGSRCHSCLFLSLINTRGFDSLNRGSSKSLWNETAGSPLDQSRQLLAGLFKSQTAACCVRAAPGAKAASDKAASDKAASDAIFVIGPSHRFARECCQDAETVWQTYHTLLACGMHRCGGARQ